MTSGYQPRHSFVEIQRFGDLLCPHQHGRRGAAPPVVVMHVYGVRLRLDRGLDYNIKLKRILRKSVGRACTGFTVLSTGTSSGLL
jgi:hypothetical protein